jgi:2'-5' RNA ligase
MNMRLFIAIELPSGVREALAPLAASLVRQAGSGRPVPVENFHLTLAFIGESKRLDDVAAIMRQTVGYNAHKSDFSQIQLSGIGSFKGNKGYTWWVGFKELPALQKLQKTLITDLIQAGFAIQQRKFMPHVTLARSVKAKTPVALELPELIFAANALSLFSSDLSGEHPRYTLQTEARFP